MAVSVVCWQPTFVAARHCLSKMFLRLETLSFFFGNIKAKIFLKVTEKNMLRALKITTHYHDLFNQAVLP